MKNSLAPKLLLIVFLLLILSSIVFFEGNRMNPGGLSAISNDNADAREDSTCAYEAPFEIFCLNSQPKPAGIDLDVTHISRTPLYHRYNVQYNGVGKPFLLPGTQNQQRWPREGELVEFTAHITNKGSLASPASVYAWFVDGIQQAAGLLPALDAGQSDTVTFGWRWAHRLDGDRLNDSHSVRFTIDPRNAIAETYETNNSLEDETGALSLVLSLPEEVYRALETPISPDLPYSAEDWLQKQIAAMNAAFANSVYPSAPNGVVERVRLDKIVITPSHPGVDWAEDGGFHIASDYRFTKSYYDPQADISGYLLHELSHLLGVIDLYQLDLPLEAVQVKDQWDQPVQMDYTMSASLPGIMSSPGIIPKSYDLYTTLALNHNKGYRRGYYGEYLFDMPAKPSLLILDRDGQPASATTVKIYQRQWLPESASSRSGMLLELPQISGRTDADGLLKLPNQVIFEPVQTETGHFLDDNPFGLIDVVGRNGTLLLEIQRGMHQEFVWLDISAFNLAAWAGENVIQIATNLPEESVILSPPVLQGQVENGYVYLSWSEPEQDADLRYTVYRAAAPTYRFEPVFSNVKRLRFIESFPQGSASAVYAVISVDAAGQESAFSQPFYALELRNPYAVEIDPAGERVILNPKSGYDLLSQSADGKMSRVLGSLSTNLDSARYMALDKRGFLYVSSPADAASNRDSVRVFDAEMRLILEFGRTGSLPGQMQNPAGIAVWGEPCGENRCRILVVDSGNNRIEVFDELGNLISAYGGEGRAPGQFRNPQGIAVDAQGRVVVVDSHNNRLQVLKFNGEKLSFSRTIRKRFSHPTDVVLLESGYIVVADTGSDKVKLLKLSGRLVEEFKRSDLGEQPAFSKPQGVAVDASGNIIVADTGNRCIGIILSAIPSQ